MISKNRIFSSIIVLCGLILSTIGFAETWVEQGPEQTDSEIYGRGGGGHEVPTPFDETRLENGQTYTLTGQVVWPYFKSCESSGTCNYYLLEGYEQSWKKWNGLKIDLRCIVHRTPFKLGDGTYRDVISLQSIKKYIREISTLNP